MNLGLAPSVQQATEASGREPQLRGRLQANTRRDWHHARPRLGGQPLSVEVTIQDLGSIGEIVGATATVATLIYLAIQIRANTQAVRSAAAQSVHEAFATWYRMLAADTDLSRIAATGLKDYEALSEAEKARFVATFMAFLSCSQDAFIKWREGSLAPELWSGWELVMMNLVIPSGGRAFWQERGYLFGKEFRDYVETHVMKQEPHPKAKPMGAFSIGSLRS